MTMTEASLGANKFSFSGDRTTITYFPQAPRPGPAIKGHDGAELRYDGPEGNITFDGSQITCVDSALGTELSVVLHASIDRPTTRLTVLVPEAFGVTRAEPVLFSTLAIKTTGRGFINSPGVDPTYDVIPLVGQAKYVELPV